MKDQEFQKLLKALREEVELESEGTNLIDTSPYISKHNINVSLIEEAVLDQRRWSNLKEAIYGVGNRYIRVCWDDPATEMQAGQYTNCTIEEVKPKKIIKIIYVPVQD